MIRKIKGRMFKTIVYQNMMFKDYLIDKFGNVYSTFLKEFVRYTLNDSGYKQVKLMVFGRFRMFKIHKLMIYTWKGGPPKWMKDPSVNHIDENKYNNHINNLEWMERRKNEYLGEIKMQKMQRKREMQEYND